jgi:tRNA threonylcarbamoyladenosine dehydratase
VSEFDFERAFGGIDRLYGAGSLATLQSKQVTVVGLGGVGSWAAEALARSGVGRLRLIDLDQVAESNINRQIQANIHTVGQAKVTALSERLLLINPLLQIEAIEAFVTVDNVKEMLAGADAVVDAIDQVSVKLAMLICAKQLKIKTIVCGGAGGKQQAELLRLCDLSETSHDALLATLRNKIRKSGQYPAKGALKVRCVSSPEPKSVQSLRQNGGLACAGYGSTVTVTAAMGLIAAGAVVKLLLKA